MAANDITILKITKKKKKYFVETSNQNHLFDEETLLKYGIFPERCFSQKEFREILDQEETIVWFSKALQYISFQLRSEAEVYSYLKKKDVVSSKITEILSRLKQFGYLDDERFVKHFAESMKQKGKGNRAIIQKLQSKGIKEADIQQYSEQQNPETEEVLVYSLVLKASKKNQTNPIRKQQTQIYQKLLRDGFSSSIIQRVIHRVEWTDQSHEQLVKDVEKFMLRYEKLDEKIKFQKVIQSLLNKGYEYSMIKETMKNHECDDGE